MFENYQPEKQSEKMDNTLQERDLPDYLNLLFRQKRLIGGVIILALVASGVFTFFVPKIYEINSSLKIGILKEGQPIERIVDLQERILFQYRDKKFTDFEISNPDNTRLLLFRIESSNPEETKKLLEKTQEEVLMQHNEKLEARQEFLEKEKANLQETKNLLEEKIKDSTLDNLLRIFFIQQLTVTKNSLYEINTELEQMEPSQIVQFPTISEKPVWPKPLLNFLVAALLGFFGGSIIAFAKEWLRRRR